MELTTETSVCSVKETAGISSASGDDSKLLPVISFISGDKWGRDWLKGSSALSTTSIISSSWLFLPNGLLWSFASGDDPTPPLSLEGVLAVSLNTGENSALFCPRGLGLSLGLGDEATESS